MAPGASCGGDNDDDNGSDDGGGDGAGSGGGGGGSGGGATAAAVLRVVGQRVLIDVCCAEFAVCSRAIFVFLLLSLVGLCLGFLVSCLLVLSAPDGASHVRSLPPKGGRGFAAHQAAVYLLIARVGERLVVATR